MLGAACELLTQYVVQLFATSQYATGVLILRGVEKWKEQATVNTGMETYGYHLALPNQQSLHNDHPERHQRHGGIHQTCSEQNLSYMRMRVDAGGRVRHAFVNSEAGFNRACETWQLEETHSFP